jgi:hydroxysqualene synthase
MSAAEEHRSGKTSQGENFPVASALIAPRYRAAIQAYYRFARAADDVADHASLSPARKLQLLDRLEATLLGRSDDDAAALPLRAEIAARRLSPEHALDLLTAFRLDVSKARYRDWDELMHYCRYSAMPVGRFVLDLHGEGRASWPANDDLCAALQVINHLQDCGKDFVALNRVYVPLDAIAAHGATVDALGARKASPELKASLHAVAARTATLLPTAAQLPGMVKDVRLSMEIAVIVSLARKLTSLLLRRDPLSERVHLSGPAMLATASLAATSGLCNALRGCCMRARARGEARWQ